MTEPNPLPKEIDSTLVDQAYQKLFTIFSENFEKAKDTAMHESGEYLLETFYDGDIERARNKDSTHKESLLQLIKKFQENSPDSSAKSKSWIYNAIGLIVQKNDVENIGDECFQTYGKLWLSHKILILSVKDLEIKEKLISEAVAKKLSVRDLSKIMKKLLAQMPENKSLLSLLKVPETLFGDGKAVISPKKLGKLSDEERDEIKAKTRGKVQGLKRKIETLNKKIKLQQKFITQYEKLSKDINARVIIPHLGGLNGGYNAIVQVGLWENCNIYADTALASTHEIQHYIETYGHERIMFGSDFPFGDPAHELKKNVNLNFQTSE